MYQRGSLKRVPRKAGETWVLRYRVTSKERRVEHIKIVGLVCDFPKVNDARREADRLLVRINEEAEDTRIHFDALAQHYLNVDMGEDAVRPKSLTTVPIVEHYVRDYLVAQWGHRIADDIKPLDSIAGRTLGYSRLTTATNSLMKVPARALFSEMSAAQRRYSE
jgi:hypothetical protein